VLGLVRQIRAAGNLEHVAQKIRAKHDVSNREDAESDSTSAEQPHSSETFEAHLSGRMGELRIDDGFKRYIGGTSNLIFLGSDEQFNRLKSSGGVEYNHLEDPITSWTTVTADSDVIMHLLNMYFTWHYTYFTTLSKDLFFRDFILGKPVEGTERRSEYCTPLLVNAMLALGCHFTAHPASREDPDDSSTAGNHFFKEAKRLLMEHDEHENPKLTTVQALALMSVREAGCAREAKGWIYSGMSFRMACDLGLNLDSGRLCSHRDSNLDEAEEDARRITFWGCFLFDK
jgi:hypothetical protein